MPDQPSPDALASLHTVAQLLRGTHHLGPEAQVALADLVEELDRALVSESLSAAEKAHLADSTAHLARAIHEQHDEGLLGQARDRLELAVARVEARAPVATGVVRRLVDALANLGI